MWNNKRWNFHELSHERQMIRLEETATITSRQFFELFWSLSRCKTVLRKLTETKTVSVMIIFLLGREAFDSRNCSNFPRVDLLIISALSTHNLFPLLQLSDQISIEFYASNEAESKKLKSTFLFALVYEPAGAFSISRTRTKKRAKVYLPSKFIFHLTFRYSRSTFTLARLCVSFCVLVAHVGVPKKTPSVSDNWFHLTRWKRDDERCLIHMHFSFCAKPGTCTFFPRRDALGKVCSRWVVHRQGLATHPTPKECNTKGRN